MTAANRAGTRIATMEGGSESIGQPRSGARVSTMSPELAGPPGYADPFGPTLPSASTFDTVSAATAARTASRNRAARNVAWQRFWGVAILVLFLLGVTAAKWFAQ